MKKYLAITALLLMVCASSISQAANSWTGSLSTVGGALTSGPTGNKQWGGKATTISWLVTQTNAGYNYSYTLTAPTGSFGISHMILECSDNFTDAGVTGKYSGSTQGQSNTGFPSGKSMFGTKFNTGATWVQQVSTTNWIVTFNSTHAPVWGDFYAKGGQSSYVYNTSLDSTFNSTDYIWQTAVGTGNYLSKIAVPDHVFLNTPFVVRAVPEASTLAGFGSSLMIAAPGLIGWLRRRRS